MKPSGFQHVLLFTLLLNSLLSQAASFDCSKASLKAEKLICASENLSALDDTLALTYKQAMAATSEQDLLKAFQIEWIKRRNKCDSNRCLENKYQQRNQLLSLIASPLHGPLSITMAEQKPLHHLEARRAGEKLVVFERGYPKYYKLLEFAPTSFQFETLYESDSEFEYVTHDNRYIAISDERYSAKAPIVLIDRKSGKKVGERGVSNLFKWGLIKGNTLIGIQYNEALIFEIPSMKILKSASFPFSFGPSPLRHVSQWKDLIILQGSGKKLWAMDHSLNTQFTLEIPKPDFPSETKTNCQTDIHVIQDDYLIVGAYCGNIYVYDLNTQKLLKRFPSIANFISYSLHDGKLWVFPREAREGEKAHVYNFESGEVESTFDMTSDLQIWSDNQLFSLEFRYSDPSMFVRLKENVGI